jgi:hypothetical protein
MGIHMGAGLDINKNNLLKDYIFLVNIEHNLKCKLCQPDFSVQCAPASTGDSTPASTR